MIKRLLLHIVILILLSHTYAYAIPPDEGCTGYACGKSLSELLGGFGYSAKGDLIIGTGSSAASRLTVGANYSIPYALSTETTGLKWLTPTTSALIGWNDSGVLGPITNHAHADNAYQFYNYTDPTKKLTIGLASITTGNTRNLTMADGDVTLTAGTMAIRIGSGTATLGTSAISSGDHATLVTVAATGVATTDVIDWGFNSDPHGVTGYVPSANGMLTIIAYPTANNVNFLVVNNTSASITPGAITLNWKVQR